MFRTYFSGKAHTNVAESKTKW